MIRRRDVHLPWRWLVERADGALAAAASAESEAHLASGCGRCTHADRVVRRLRAAVAAGPLDAPPAVADRRVLEMVRRLRAARDADDVLIATLVLDRRPDEALSLRAAAPEERRLLWTMPGYEIDASVVATARGADVLGQIVPEEDAAGTPMDGEVRARRGRRVVAYSRVAPDGRFTFRSLARGLVEIEGVARGQAFVLPGFVVE